MEMHDATTDVLADDKYRSFLYRESHSVMEM